MNILPYFCQLKNKTLTMRIMIKKSNLLTLTAILILTGCGNGKQDKKTTDTSVKVSTMTVGNADSKGFTEYQGTVEESSGTNLSFASMGTIMSIKINMGDKVQKGQLIATLDPTTARSTYNAALAMLKQAEDAYRRMEELHTKGSLPEIKWVETQSALSKAQATEQAARKQLADCRLTAPFSGVIADKMAETGQNVMPGTPVARLVSVSGQQVRISVPEAEIGKISIGDKATVDIGALGGKRYSATVTEKGATANMLSRSYDVKLNVHNAGTELLPGMVASVTLSNATGAMTPVIPSDIVQIDEHNNTFVWIVSNGKAEKRIINCGEFAGNGVAVTSGLQPGERIIVKGSQKVCNGTPVKAI